MHKLILHAAVTAVEIFGQRLPAFGTLKNIVHLHHCFILDIPFPVYKFSNLILMSQNKGIYFSGLRVLSVDIY